MTSFMFYRLILDCSYCQISSVWFLPFAYVIVAEHIYSLVEFLFSGGTIRGWWNDQRMWIYKRVTSYLFAYSYVVIIFWLAPLLLSYFLLCL